MLLWKLKKVTRTILKAFIPDKGGEHTMSGHYKGIKMGFAVLLCMCLSGLTLKTVEALEPVKVALVYSETGIAAPENKPAAGAARIAVEEINHRGGLLGRPLELILIDNKSTPLGSKRAAEKAIKLKVATVIGAFRSSHSLPLAKSLQAAGIPMISPSSTKPAITLSGPYIFRACFIDSFQGQAMARFAFFDLGAKRAGVLINNNEGYSLTLSEYFIKAFRELGGKALLQGNYKGMAIDFSEVISKVKDSRPDVLFIPGYSRDSGLLIKQAVRNGIKTTFLGGDAWGNQIYDYGGSALEGSYYSAQYHPAVPFARNQHLKKIYRDKYDMDNITNMRIPLTYDAVLIFSEAVQRAGSIEPDKIRDALARTKNFQGATGTITFNLNGDPMDKEASILGFQKGSWIFVKSLRP